MFHPAVNKPAPSAAEDELGDKIRPCRSRVIPGVLTFANNSARLTAFRVSTRPAVLPGLLSG
jgi:hypothetical protein